MEVKRQLPHRSDLLKRSLVVDPLLSLEVVMLQPRKSNHPQLVWVSDQVTSPPRKVVKRLNLNHQVASVASLEVALTVSHEEHV